MITALVIMLLLSVPMWIGVLFVNALIHAASSILVELGFCPCMQFQFPIPASPSILHVYLFHWGTVSAFGLRLMPGLIQATSCTSSVGLRRCAAVFIGNVILPACLPSSVLAFTFCAMTFAFAFFVFWRAFLLSLPRRATAVFRSWDGISACPQLSRLSCTPGGEKGGRHPPVRLSTQQLLCSPHLTLVCSLHPSMLSAVFPPTFYTPFLFLLSPKCCEHRCRSCPAGQWQSFQHGSSCGSSTSFVLVACLVATCTPQEGHMERDTCRCSISSPRTSLAWQVG